MTRIRIPRWIETTGGPHLLIAEELLHYWRGTKGWHDHRDPNDQSDYARACRITTWLGQVQCNAGTALVLSGDVGDMAWMPNPLHEGGFLVQRLGVDDEKLIEPTLNNPALANLLEAPDAEAIEFHTGPSGAMRLFDSAEPGDELRGDSQVLTLKPGSHRMRAGIFRSAGIMIVVREISRIQ
jgi:hypothetical protein